MGQNVPHGELEQVADQVTPARALSLATTALSDALVLAVTVGGGGPENPTETGNDAPSEPSQALRHRRTVATAAARNVTSIGTTELSPSFFEAFFVGFVRGQGVMTPPKRPCTPKPAEVFHGTQTLQRENIPMSDR